MSLAEPAAEFHNADMARKDCVLGKIYSVPTGCSLEERSERIEFMAAVQTGLDQLDRGEGIPHDDVKKQLASWLKLSDDLHKQ